MIGEVVPFRSSFRNAPHDWSAQELAEFYRVESALIQGGMRIVTDRGLSDEGDPWFVFCRVEDGEPIAHFARIDGRYVIASAAYSATTYGADFRVMVKNLIARHNFIPDAGSGTNVFVHPAALLIILVGAAFFKTSSHAHAAETLKEGTLGQRLTEQYARVATQPLGSSEISGQQVEQNWARKLFALASVVALTEYMAIAEPYAVESTGPEPALTFGGDGARQESTYILDDPKAFSGFAGPTSGSDLSAPVVGYVTESEAGFSLLSKAAGETDHHRPDAHFPSLFAESVGFFETAGEISQFSGFANESGWGGLAPISERDLTVLLASRKSVDKVAPTAGAPPSQAVEVAPVSQVVEVAPSKVVASVGAGQNVSASERSAHYENAIVVDQLPGFLKSAGLYATATSHLESAESFLADNGILINIESDTSRFDTSVLMSGHSVSMTGVAISESAQSAESPADSVVMSSGGWGSGSSIDLSLDVVVRTLELFLQQTPDAGVVLAGDDPDAYIFFAPPEEASATMESIVISFDDGSAIRIVGQQEVLHDLVSQVS